MDSPIEVDSGPECLPQDSYEDVTKFNRDVLNEIEKRSQEKPSAFRLGSMLVHEDHAILLHILLKASYPECTMDQRACQDHLGEHLELYSILNDAYINGNFAVVMTTSEMPSRDDIFKPASTINLGIDACRSQSTGLEAAFRQQYLGNTAKLFIDTLNKERQAYSRKTGVHTPYNWSISVVQSSGVGKSRMVEEAGNTVFTFPINLREETAEGNLAYPPEDKNMRQFFKERRGLPDEEQRVHYAILLRMLFIKARDLVRANFPGMTGPELARAWADYLEEGQTDQSVGKNRREFYDEVIQTATEVIRKKNQKPYSPEGPLTRSCKEFLDLIHPDRAALDNACFVYFDEAQTLAQIGGENTGGEQKRSPFHNLGIVLSGLDIYQVFFIFLSTNPRLEGWAPPPFCHPSSVVMRGSVLISPFTELPFDVYEDKILKSLGSLTLKNAGEMKTMVKFGRPLWYSHVKARPDADVFDFAMEKLRKSEEDKNSANLALAALGVRVGIAFDEMRSYSVQSDLVESHLRVVYSIPEHRKYMHTGSPSEPVVAEVAGRFLASDGRRGIATEGPKWICYALEKGLLAHGGRRELVGRLLMTSAHDIALTNKYGEYKRIPNEPAFHRPIPVLDFLDALFHNQHHRTIRSAKCVTGREGVKSLDEAFSDSYIFFSHFALAEDSEMLSTPALATALVRGMAVQTEAGQEYFDAVIPIHMGSLATPISPETTSAINLKFKNPKETLDFYDNRSTTAPEEENPVISIIFEFGVKGEKANSVETLNTNLGDTHDEHSAQHPDDNHYQIVARGCSSAIFGAILPETEWGYQAILGAGTVLEDFPRCDDPNNVAALQGLKPAFSGKKQKERYIAWSLGSDDIGSAQAD